MILRKPYGFLIKHFKFIHLILTGLYIYLAGKVNGIYRYYDAFLGGTESKLNAIKYVTNYYVIAILVSIVICLIVYALMRYKKKPRLLYLILMALYIGVAVMISISYEGLQTIYISVLDIKTLRLYRDLLQMVLWIQYLSIIFVFIRGLGFDVKKFNFVKDLHELGIDVSDEEEVELTLGGTETAQRKVHRGFRELKYYYLENRVFIHIILIILVMVGVSTYTVDKEIINKKYEEGEVFTTNNFSFQVLNTYITTNGYQGNIIGDLEHSFVVVRMLLRSNGEKREFNTANLILKVNNNSYESEVRYANSFVDLGTVYQKQLISGDSTYLFLFPVLKEELDDKMELVYAEKKIVVLNPISLDEVRDTNKYTLGSKIDLSTSVMKSGYLTISSYEIKPSFVYSYQYDVMGQTFTSEMNIQSDRNTIMHLKLNSSYPRNFSDFDILSQYGKLKYKIRGEEYSSSVFQNQTPGSYKDGLYIVVDNLVMEASEIWFEIQIRDQKYVYTLLG